MKRRVVLSLGIIVCCVNLFISLISVIVCFHTILELNRIDFDVSQVVTRHMRSNNTIRYLEESGITNLSMSDISNMLYVPEDHINEMATLDGRLDSVIDGVMVNILATFCTYVISNLTMLIIIVIVSIRIPTEWH